MHIENNCMNCGNYGICKLARKSKVVVWKHCDKFTPSARAVKAAMKDRERKRLHDLADFI